MGKPSAPVTPNAGYGYNRLLKEICLARPFTYIAVIILSVSGMLFAIVSPLIMRSLIDDVLKLEPAARVAVKRLVLDCATQEDRAVLDAAAHSLVGLLRRPEALQGIDAFMAKTAPPWAKD